jgi:REP element-mobilizing transposase RayT
MRRARIKADGEGYYHGMSRVIEKRPILGPREKARLLTLLRKLAGFSGLEILTYAILDNHFHVLLHVPRRQELSDEDLLERLRFLHTPEEVELIGRQLQDLRGQGQDRAAEALKARFTYRMYDVSEFFKALKQRFSQDYNSRTERCGPLWEQRFKSVLVERSEQALAALAAYIDLNPVRAGLVSDPKDYRYSGYGEAMGGGREARQGLRRWLEATRGRRVSWGRTQAAYRQHLYIRGRQRGVDGRGGPMRAGFTPEEVKQVLAQGGQLTLPELLRCRVRYFSDGLALGSAGFVEQVFERYRERFGPGRRRGAVPMPCRRLPGESESWSPLCTLRHLRLDAVSPC